MLLTICSSVTLNSFQGTAQLHQALHSKLSQHLQTFEQYAKETCLHIPAGLMAAEVRHI